MDARAKTIRDILYSRDQYLVPFFQRQYSWRRQQWQRLWDDALVLLEQDVGGQHFLGPLVCTPFEQIPTVVSKYQLIDGQQRLTTLTILLAALRDVARERGEQAVEEEVNEDFLVHKREEGWARMKILPRTGDREVLGAIIGRSLVRGQRRDGLARAYRFFKRAIEKHLESVKEVRPELRRILSAITSQLSLVVITIEGENPYEIFESLNSTGLPLEESDLIRNYLFMQVPLEGQEKFNFGLWEPFESIFEANDSHGAISATKFYRNYVMRSGAYSRRGATFADFKRSHVANGQTPAEVVEELTRFAEYERMLRYPSECEDTELRAALETLARLDLTTAFPLLMRLMELRDSGDIELSELISCVEDLASFALRRSICGESTRPYNQWFVGAARDLGSEPRKKLQEEWLKRGWPDDAAFRKAMETFALYRREQKKARLILDKLEDSSGHKEKVRPDALTIEHVMPQTVGDDAHGRAWRKELGADWRRVHVDLLHTLGNLTLTGYNPELSKRPYAAKRPILKESRLALNDYFGNLDSWDEGAIRNRSRALAETVCALWPRADSDAPYVPTGGTKPRRKRKRLSKEHWDDYWAEFRLATERSPSWFPPLSAFRNGKGMWLRSGRGGIHFLCKCSERKGMLHVGLVGRGRRARPMVEALRPHRAKLEKALGAELWWKGGRLEVRRPGVDFSDREAWAEHHEWMLNHLVHLIPIAQSLFDALILNGEEEVASSQEAFELNDTAAEDDQDDEDDEDEDED